MKCFNFVVCWFLIFLFSGCVGPQINWSNSNQIAESVKVTRDEFKKLTKYRGPTFRIGVLGEPTYLFLRAFKLDKAEKIVCQIYIQVHYWGDWRFYKYAHDSEGKKMDFTLIDRKVGTCGPGRCSKDEHIALNVTKSYLEAHKDTGIRVQISSKAGEDTICHLPGSYVKAFLSVVWKTLGKGD